MTAPARRGRPPRPFTLLDGLILVGAAGVGFAVARARSIFWTGGGDFSAIESAIAASDTAGHLLLVLSGLVLALRLRRPRPPLWRVARQPGAAACFAALAVEVGEAYARVVYRATQWDFAWEPLVDDLSLDCLTPTCETGFAVAALWFVFALGRVGRPEPAWVDRAGRAVGWAWIAWGVGVSFVQFFWK